MVHQHVDKVLEEAGLAGTEEALRDLLDGLLQLRKTIVVGQSVIAERRGDMKVLLRLVDMTIVIAMTNVYRQKKGLVCTAKHSCILCHLHAIWQALASR